MGVRRGAAPFCDITPSLVRAAPSNVDPAWVASPYPGNESEQPLRRARSNCHERFGMNAVLSSTDSSC